ncbi:MAG: endonuclease/exonuclease/phosphatase family protein [Candidatus Poribacteria bacterium]|nr:endonuclease/exonuclease/phosphatase family protein [Candidatus Poribacteria bacterium]
MNVLTCNIRTSLAKDGENDWVHRKSFCAEVIRSYDPHLIGFQEVSVQQHADLRAAFPEFDRHALIDHAQDGNPTNAIYWARDRFECVSAGGFWLSETPHVTGSWSWESRCVRLANWVRLVDKKSGIEFRFINTHLDHVSQEAREEQARVVNEDAAAFPAEYPQLLTGDMNAPPDNAAIKAFLDGGWTDTYVEKRGVINPCDTFHGFLGDAYEYRSGKIDWVFSRGAVKIESADVLIDERDGRYPSDHHFVMATVNVG